MDGVKEAQCARCAHFEVCALKEEFLAAQEAIDNTSMSFKEKDLDRVAIVYIRNLDWIKPIELQCKHYMKKGDVLTR